MSSLVILLSLYFFFLDLCGRMGQGTQMISGGLRLLTENLETGSKCWEVEFASFIWSQVVSWAPRERFCPSGESLGFAFFFLLFHTTKTIPEASISQFSMSTSCWLIFSGEGRTGITSVTEHRTPEFLWCYVCCDSWMFDICLVTTLWIYVSF